MPNLPKHPTTNSEMYLEAILVKLDQVLDRLPAPSSPEVKADMQAFAEALSRELQRKGVVKSSDKAEVVPIREPAMPATIPPRNPAPQTPKKSTKKGE